MKKQNTHDYKSRDFYLSGYIIASGIQLKSWYKTGKTTTFIFEYSKDVDGLIADYYSMKARVNPVEYGQSLKNLKSIIHSNSNTQSHIYNEQSNFNSRQ